LVNIEAGKSFTCEPRIASENEWGVIKVSAMTWGEFRQNENKAVPGHRAIDARHEITEGDILVSRANTEAYVGAPVLVGPTRPKLLLSDKSLRLKPLPEIDKNWLFQVLASSATRSQISARATGTKDSMRNISQRNLATIRIPIPPVEQMRQVGEQAASNVAVAQQLEAALEHAQLRATHLRRSLLATAFGGRLVPQNPHDEPAAELLARIKAQRSKGTKPSPARRTPFNPSVVPAGIQEELPL